jgi:MFS family permease
MTPASARGGSGRVSSLGAVRRLLLLVSLIVLVDTAFYAAISPLLPYYEHRLGLGKDGAGVLSAAYAAGTLVGALPSGWAAARFGVKPAVLAGLALLVASSVAFGLAHSVGALDAARFVQGFGGALSWAGAMAWLVGVAPAERRGEVIGLAFGVAIGGALLGPVLGAAARAAGPGPVFAGVGAAGTALAVAAALFPAAAPPERQPVSAMLAAVRHPEVAAGMWLVAVPGLLFGCLGVLVPLRLDRLGASGAAIAACFLVAAAGEAVISSLAGWLSDQHGRMSPMRIGLALSAGLTVLLPLPDTALLLAVVTIVASTAYGLFWAPSMALLSDGAEAAGLDQGYAFALVNLAWALGQVAGSAGGGAAGRLGGDALPYLVLAGVCVLTLTALRRRAVPAT